MSTDESRPIGYPITEEEGTSSSSSIYEPNLVTKAGSFSYSRYGNGGDVSSPSEEIGWDQMEEENGLQRPYMIRWKSGKKVDGRLLMVLESFFEEIYVKRNEFFKKIFPDVYNEFVNVFKKIGEMLWRNNNSSPRSGDGHVVMKRSLSAGTRSSSTVETLRLERFRVKTPNVVVSQPPPPGPAASVSSMPPPK